LLLCADVYDGEVICVLDGLDECRAKDRRVTIRKPFYPRDELITLLKDTYADTEKANNKDRILKFLISARKTTSQEFKPLMSELAIWSDISTDEVLSQRDLKAFIDYKILALELDENVKKDLTMELLKV
jgi:hypothetical protein